MLRVCNRLLGRIWRIFFLATSVWQRQWRRHIYQIVRIFKNSNANFFLVDLTNYCGMISDSDLHLCIQVLSCWFRKFQLQRREMTNFGFWCSRGGQNAVRLLEVSICHNLSKSAKIGINLRFYKLVTFSCWQISLSKFCHIFSKKMPKGLKILCKIFFKW